MFDHAHEENLVGEKPRPIKEAIAARDSESPASEAVQRLAHDTSVPRPIAVPHLLYLQRAAGNASVAEILRHEISPGASLADRLGDPHAPAPLSQSQLQSGTSSLPFVAQIRRREPTVMQALAAPAAPLRVGDGERTSLPDIVLRESWAPADSDAVAGTITYAPAVTEGDFALAADQFGGTWWNVFRLTGIMVTPTAGTFIVEATLENPIKYRANERDETDIESENDADLTKENYVLAANDLTPDASTLGGCPPRTKFWAKDLTLRHEEFHAIERQAFGKEGVVAAQAWLNTQAAGDIADVQNLLAAVPGQVMRFSKAKMVPPGTEERAYSDGAPSYQERATAIAAKGARGEYP